MTCLFKSQETDSEECLSSDGSSSSWDGMPLSRPLLLDDRPLSKTVQWYAPPSREYSRRELVVGRVVDFGGLLLGFVGGVALVCRSGLLGDAALKQFGLFVYACSIVAMFGCSAVCHHNAWNWKAARWYSSLDYLGISALIAGSYTPPMLEVECYRTLAFVWALAVLGTLLDAWRVARGDEQTSGAYRCVLITRFLIMGWCVLVVMPTLASNLAHEYVYLIAAGGLLYTMGIPVFLSTKEFHMPAWHVFVTLAALSMYLGNFLYIAGV